jgi:hypothetical protein
MGDDGAADSSPSVFASSSPERRDAGARVELLDLRELGLPMHGPELEADPPTVVGTLIDTCMASRVVALVERPASEARKPAPADDAR